MLCATDSFPGAGEGWLNLDQGLPGDDLRLRHAAASVCKGIKDGEDGSRAKLCIYHMHLHVPFKTICLERRGRIQPLVSQMGERAAAKGKTLVDLLMPATLGCVRSPKGIRCGLLPSFLWSHSLLGKDPVYLAVFPPPSKQSVK